MAQHEFSPARRQHAVTAEIVDFEDAKARWRESRCARSEHVAAQALAAHRAGQAPLHELMRALVAPFNR